MEPSEERQNQVTFRERLIKNGKTLRRDGTLKDATQLNELYSNLDKGREVTTYCQSGYRAAHSWLVLRLLGFDRVGTT